MIFQTFLEQNKYILVERDQMVISLKLMLGGATRTGPLKYKVWIVGIYKLSLVGD